MFYFRLYNKVLVKVMSSPLYVFETILPSGYRVVGSAGLPKSDMANLMTFYNNKVTRIVPMVNGTSRLKILTPISEKSQ